MIQRVDIVGAQRKGQVVPLAGFLIPSMTSEMVSQVVVVSRLVVGVPNGFPVVFLRPPCMPAICQQTSEVGVGGSNTDRVPVLPDGGRVVTALGKYRGQEEAGVPMIRIQFQGLAVPGDRPVLFLQLLVFSCQTEISVRVVGCDLERTAILLDRLLVCFE